jgi:predicted helicase
MKTCSHDRGTNCFPLYLCEDSSNLQFGHGQRLNFTAGFLRALSNALQITSTQDNGVPAGLTPEDIFHYAYAVFHSPGYRGRYVEFLKTEFPRLPLTGSLELFRALARLGGELVGLHLLESPRLDQPITEFIGSNREVAKVGYADGTVWIDASGTKKETSPGTSGFRGVPEAVWNFHIGGYQVCEKWLKDRKGRTLSADDIAHYHKIVVALAETIRLMAEIDRVIDDHGGWPGAFQTAGTAA